MKNKLWITVGLIAALMTAGCAEGAKPAADAGTEQAGQEIAADQAEAEDETGAAADQAA